MTVGSAVTPETFRCDGLPPKAYWLIDPSVQIETPTDSRGLIVVNELVESAKQYISPEFDWASGPPPDKHHLYYTEATYRFFEEWSKGEIPAYEFREQAANKIYTPRLFHNVIHRVMLPAPIPNAEVMRNFIDAWDTARNLFASVRRAVRAEMGIRGLGPGALTEHERVDEEIAEEVIRKHFGEISTHVGALTLIPEDFRPFRLDGDVRQSANQFCDVLEHGSQRRAGALVLPSRIQETCSCLHCTVNSSIITSVIN